MYYTYILQCDDHYYVGQTDDLERRLLQHQRKQSTHTKRYSSVKLIYYEKFEVRSDAENREKQIKGWSRAKKQALINGQFDELKKLSKSRS